jgi:hypothetical protein
MRPVWRESERTKTAAVKDQDSSGKYTACPVWALR